MLMERYEHPQRQIEPPHRVSPSWAAAPDRLHVPSEGPACRETGTQHLTSGVWGDPMAPICPRTFLKEGNNKEL